MAKKPNIGKSISKATKSTTKAVAKTAAPVAKTVAKTAAPVAAPVAKATVVAAKTVGKAAAPVAAPVAKATVSAAKSVAKASAPIVNPIAKATEKVAIPAVVKAATVAAAGTAAIAKKAVPAPNKTDTKKSAPAKQPAKKEDDKYKKMYEDCNKTSDMQRTEITNLKYRITAADNDKKDLLSQVNTMNSTISNQKNEIGALNTKVNVLDRRINGPLVQVSGKNSTNKNPNNSVGSKISSSIKKMFGIKKPKSNKKGKKNNFTGHMEEDDDEQQMEDDDEQQMEEGFQEGAEDLTSIYRGKPKEVYDITPGTSTGLEPAATNYGTLYNTYYKGYEDSQTLIQDVLEPEVKYLQTVEVKDIKYAYAAVQQQNKTLESQINETADEYSTDFQRAKYVEEQVESVKMRNAIMFFLYYILFFVFAFLLFTGGSDMSMKMKVGVLLIVFTYPYWIAYLSSLTSFVYNYSVALFRGVPYEPSLK